MSQIPIQEGPIPIREGYNDCALSLSDRFMFRRLEMTEEQAELKMRKSIILHKPTGLRKRFLGIRFEKRFIDKKVLYGANIWIWIEDSNLFIEDKKKGEDMFKNAFYNFITLLLFIMTAGCFYAALTVTYPIAFINIVLVILALFFLIMACSRIDKAMGFGQNQSKSNMEGGK